MRRINGVVFAFGLLAVSVMCTGIAMCAESKPLRELPTDLMRWSTLWTAIPRQMYEVGQEDGPLAAVTWGPTKGTAQVIQQTTEELWNAAKPDHRPGHESTVKGSNGVLLRYEF